MNWELSEFESIWLGKYEEFYANFEFPLVVLIRVRNEGLILSDTLEHLSDFADLIVAYDDASVDNTRQILKSHPKVALIIENNKWLDSLDDRLIMETRHRGLLLLEARKRFKFRWCMCCDADERYIGNIRNFVSNPNIHCLPDALKIQLFDAYMTVEDQDPFQQGSRLLNFRKKFGPERRDILMLWKNKKEVLYCGLDSREPIVPGIYVNKFYCQHYGKSLSIEHWEETCDYYINHFPYEPYGKKWIARKGHAIHNQSDFGRPLFQWGDNLFNNAVKDF